MSSPVWTIIGLNRLIRVSHQGFVSYAIHSTAMALNNGWSSESEVDNEMTLSYVAGTK